MQKGGGKSRLSRNVGKKSHGRATQSVGFQSPNTGTCLAEKSLPPPSPPPLHPPHGLSCKRDKKNLIQLLHASPRRPYTPYNTQPLGLRTTHSPWNPPVKNGVTTAGLTGWIAFLTRPKPLSLLTLPTFLLKNEKFPHTAL